MNFAQCSLRHRTKLAAGLLAQQPRQLRSHGLVNFAPTKNKGGNACHNDKTGPIEKSVK